MTVGKHIVTVEVEITNVNTFQTFRVLIMPLIVLITLLLILQISEWSINKNDNVYNNNRLKMMATDKSDENNCKHWDQVACL